MQSLIQSIEYRLVKIEQMVAGLSLSTLLALSVLQILIRNLFDFGYPEIDIINRNLLVVCGATGAVLATSKLRHIKIDALTPLLAAETLRKLHIPLALFSMLVCGFMCYYGIIFCLDEWQYAPANERWTLPFTLTYPIGFCLIGFHFVATCFRTPGE